MPADLNKKNRESLLEDYRNFLAENGLKYTKQREVIVEEFLQSGAHISAEDLHARVQKRNKRIGLASIYRTLSSLVDAGLAVERRFLDKSSVYEYNDPKEHHDHLICTKCHHIFEFENDEIERLQVEVAKKLGFALADHRLELFGRCQRKNCKYMGRKS